MPKTKDQIVSILTRKKTGEMLNASAWGDLVSAIQTATPAQKNEIVKQLVSGKSKLAGVTLQGLLNENAKERAKSFVNTALANNSLSLEELDDLL